jgi:hypothetical protein
MYLVVNWTMSPLETVSRSARVLPFPFLVVLFVNRQLALLAINSRHFRPFLQYDD